MKKQRKIGIVMICAAVLIMGIYVYFNWIRNDTEKTTVVSTLSNGEENIDPVNDMEMITPEMVDSETTDPDEKSTSEAWDGENVELDFSINTSFKDLGLNEEVLSMIHHDTDTLAEQLQLYLRSSYDITDITSVEWDGLCTVDYINHQVGLTFDIQGSQECGLQCIYNQTEKKWSFNMLGGN